MQNFQGLSKNKVGLPGVINKKLCGIVTQFYLIFRGGALVCLASPGVNWKNHPGGFSKVYVLNPLVWLLSGIAH